MLSQECQFPPQEQFAQLPSCSNWIWLTTWPNSWARVELLKTTQLSAISTCQRLMVRPVGAAATGKRTCTAVRRLLRFVEYWPALSQKSVAVANMVESLCGS